MDKWKVLTLLLFDLFYSIFFFKKKKLISWWSYSSWWLCRLSWRSSWRRSSSCSQVPSSLSVSVALKSLLIAHILTDFIWFHSPLAFRTSYDGSHGSVFDAARFVLSYFYLFFSIIIFFFFFFFQKKIVQKFLQLIMCSMSNLMKHNTPNTLRCLNCVTLKQHWHLNGCQVIKMWIVSIII